MRHPSTSRKRCEYEKYMESRVLISSNTLNPLSKNISSKLDLIKQQLSREFHQKFQSEKKPRANTIKKSASASKQRQLSKNKRENEDLIKSKITGKKLNFQESGTDNYSCSYNKTQQNIDTDYRDKYYELQDKLLNEKEKYIMNTEQQNNFKQLILNFIEEPSQKTAQPLKDTFQERYHKSLERIISLSEDVRFAENTLNEMMVMLDVEDIESLLNQFQSLSKRHTNRKTADDYSFKILQLQTKINKMQQQHEEKVKELVSKYQSQKQIYLEEQQKNILSLNDQIFGFQKEKHSLVQDIKQFYQQIEDLSYARQGARLQSQQNQSKSYYHCNSAHSRAKSTKSQREQRSGQSQKIIKSFKQESKQISFGAPEMIKQVKKKFKMMEKRVQAIEKQAEQNVELFVNSRNDLSRLEKILEEIKDDSQIEKQKIINNYEIALAEKEEEMKRAKRQLQSIDQLYSKVKQQLSDVIQQNIKIEEKSEQIQNQLQEAHAVHSQKEEHLWKTILKVRDMMLKYEILTENQTQRYNDFNQEYYPYKGPNTRHTHNQLQNRLNKFMSMIEKNLAQNLENLKTKIITLKQMNQWHKKQLAIKQSLLEEFDFNLKKLVEDAQNFGDKERKLIFERDEYKFLLENLREQVIILKREHSQSLQKTIKDKDKEYLTSNAQILETNSKIQQELTELKISYRKKSDSLEDITSQYKFYHKKAEQQEETLYNLQRRVDKAESEASKYKKCLEEIQSSFREVESMSEINSMKMTDLQTENSKIVAQITKMKAENIKLENLCTEKNEKLKEVTYALEQKIKLADKLAKQKEEVEDVNSKMRISKIQLNQEVRSLNKELSTMKIENTQLLRQNNKLSQDIAEATRKLIMNVSKRSFEDIENRKKINGLLKDLITDYRVTRQDIFEQISENKKQINEQVKRMMKIFEERLFSARGKSDNTQIVSELQTCQQQIIYLREENQKLKEEICNTKEYFNNKIKNILQSTNTPNPKHQKIYDELFKDKLQLQSVSNQIYSLKDEFKHLHSELTASLQNIISQFTTKQSGLDLGLNRYFSFKDVNSPQMPSQNNEYVNNEDQALSFEKINVDDEEDQDSDELTESPQFAKEDGEEQKQDDEEIILEPKQSKLKLDKMNMETEGDRVNYILQALKNNSDIDFKLSYAEQIKGNFDQLKKKINAKSPLNLDISGISYPLHSHPHLISPTSVSFSKDFLLEHKRMSSEPTQDHPRASNRSSQEYSHSNLKRENEHLKKQLGQLQEYIKGIEDKEELLIVQINELEKKNTILENQSSQKTIEKLFLRFIDAFINEKIEEMQTNCRTLMKIMGVEEQEITKVMEYFMKRKKKKASGLAGLFAK